MVVKDEIKPGGENPMGGNQEQEGRAAEPRGTVVNGSGREDGHWRQAGRAAEPRGTVVNGRGLDGGQPAEPERTDGLVTPVKRKRGRPRKNNPENAVVLRRWAAETDREEASRKDEEELQGQEPLGGNQEQAGRAAEPRGTVVNGRGRDGTGGARGRNSRGTIQPAEPFPENEERSYTKEDNRAALLRQIDEIEEAYLAGKIPYKDKSAQQYAIRFRLQDKFDMDASGDERRVIVVPQKHDYVCPYTHRECSSMPSKEACMKYYDLIERPRT